MREITEEEHDDLRELQFDHRSASKAFEAAQVSYANQCNLLEKRAEKIWAVLRAKYELDATKAYEVRGRILEERLANPLCRES